MSVPSASTLAQPLARSIAVALALGCGGNLDTANAPSQSAPTAAGSTPLPAAPRVATSAAPAASAAPEASATAPGASASAAAAKSAPPPPDPAHASAIDEENVYARDHAASAAEIPLFDENKKPLPQTDVEPSVKSASFEARMLLLARAIASGDANSALPAFFPSVAYAQVKDIPAPEKDWEHRLVAAFRRDVAEYHEKLGDEAAKATLAAVEVPENKAKFMKPGSEGNRVGYYRVLRSKLTFRKSDGKEQSFELTSMISWRGEWYVVHLHGFK